jgi:hypothetical protein
MNVSTSGLIQLLNILVSVEYSLITIVCLRYDIHSIDLFSVLRAATTAQPSLLDSIEQDFACISSQLNRKLINLCKLCRFDTFHCHEEVAFSCLCTSVLHK